MNRTLTDGERALVRGMYGNAIVLEGVEIRRRRWFPFQPREVAMAPMGHIHFHPAGSLYCDDFAAAGLGAQGLLIHEMAHVLQAQTRGRFYLPLMRHPFCRYNYNYVPGRPFTAYGLEQQAEIVRHAFLLRHGRQVPGKPDLATYEALLPF
jgi:hypothetical protein